MSVFGHCVPRHNWKPEAPTPGSKTQKRKANNRARGNKRAKLAHNLSVRIKQYETTVSKLPSSVNPRCYHRPGSLKK